MLTDLERKVLEAFGEEIGAPSGLVAKDLGISTSKVTTIARKLAVAGLLEDTGYAMRYEGRSGNWQYIDRPKSEGGMISKPGASTVWKTTLAGHAALQGTVQESKMSTYRVTIKYWDRHYGEGHVQFKRSFEARTSAKADKEAIDILEAALKSHPNPQGRIAEAWAERSDRSGPRTLRKYDGSSGRWIQVDPMRPAEPQEARRYPTPPNPPPRHVARREHDLSWSEWRRDFIAHIEYYAKATRAEAEQILNRYEEEARTRFKNGEDPYEVAVAFWGRYQDEPTHMREARRVADFNTLDDLVDHAARELGATHVLFFDEEIHIYFPRQDGMYEKAEVWQRDGYWHAQGPGSRVIVKRPPAAAKPIDEYEREEGPHSWKPGMRAVKAGGRQATKPGRHGTLKLWKITYKDSINPAFGEDSFRTWAYDREAAQLAFDEQTEEDGESWEIVKIEPVLDTGPKRLSR